MCPNSQTAAFLSDDHFRSSSVSCYPHTGTWLASAASWLRVSEVFRECPFNCFFAKITGQCPLGWGTPSRVPCYMSGGTSSCCWPSTARGNTAFSAFAPRLREDEACCNFAGSIHARSERLSPWNHEEAAGKGATKFGAPRPCSRSPHRPYRDL